MKTTLTVALMAVLAATTAGAQVVVHEQVARAEAEHQLQVALEKATAGALHVSIESKLVTGAPYTGEAVTESVQTLADGNRIVRKSSVRVYRDSAGRTRRETLGPDGQVTSVSISDPVKKVSYVLDPRTSTARLIKAVASYVIQEAGHVSVAGGGVAGGTAAATGTAVHVVTARDKDEAKAVSEHELQVRLRAERLAAETARATARVRPVLEPVAAPTKEDLGEQSMEGVLVKGTRSTSVIAAGRIGNELPITVVSEEWSSPELKVLVMTKHSDPRAGETTYRLTNINRTEPDALLFDVPAGYTVK